MRASIILNDDSACKDKSALFDIKQGSFSYYASISIPQVNGMIGHPWSTLLTSFVMSFSVPGHLDTPADNTGNTC